MWRYMSVTLTTRRWKIAGLKFEDSQGRKLARPCLKKQARYSGICL
jgi:hypothetical protein